MGAKTISFCKGKGNINHNNREFFTPNVDKEKTPNNIIFKQEPLKDAYEKCFGEALKTYNEKQTRNDRKIESYLHHIEHSKNGEKPFYENVVQVGDMYDSNVNTKDSEACKEVLKQYAEDFQERNPNLYVFNMTLHMDEQTPHLHIDYIPVATGYQKGMSVRNSLDKGLVQQGIEKGAGTKKDNATSHWQQRERDYIKNLCQDRGIETKEIGIDRQNFTIDEYRVLGETVKKELKQCPVKKIEATPTLFNKDKVVVDKDQLKELEKRAKVAKVYRETFEDAFKEAKGELTELATKKKMVATSLDENQKERLKLDQLYQDQLQLNKNYNVVLEAYNHVAKQKKELTQKLEEAHTRTDQAVKQAVEPLQKQVNQLKEQIKALEEKNTGTYQVLVETTKAVGMLKYSKGEYKAELSAPQERLIDGIRKYAADQLEKEELPEMAKEVKTHVFISTNLKPFVGNYKEINYYKGSKGWGFYASKAEGGEYLGGKDDLSALKETYPSATFKDPHERIPEISGYYHSR